MNIILKRANGKDALDIFTMQITSFYPLLEKYQDYETSPANEPIQSTNDDKNKIPKWWIL